MLILAGVKIAEEKLEVLKAKISIFKTVPKMTIIQVGDIFESNKYIGIKIKKASSIGIKTNLIKLDNKIKQDQLINLIQDECKKTDGLIVQLPLPIHLDKQLILNAVDFKKDIDGLSQANHDLLYQNQDCIFPATAKAIFSLLSYYKIKIKNQKISIIGESNLVGKPIKELLKREGGIVTSYTKESGIKGTENSEILIVAAGSPNLVKAENVKNNAIIIDVGVSKVDLSNKIYGDVDFESVKNKIKGISPTIGGVGPLTVVSLLENLIQAYEKNYHNDLNYGNIKKQ